MKKSLQQRAFTLIELLVVISIIAILAGVSLPVFGEVQVKGRQTAALSNAKQIGLSAKIYASDHDGRYPSKQVDASGDPGTADVTNSNEAFRQLFPDYNQTEKLFFVGKSSWSIKQPDEVITAEKALEAGENHWAYVINLTDTSKAEVPLIADGFTETEGKYTKAEDQKGGVWKGKKAIVIRADVSGSVEKVDPDELTVTRKVGTTKVSIFDEGEDWLGPTQKPVNPLE